MCNSYDEIFVERAGLIEETDWSFADEVQYRQVDNQITLVQQPKKRHLPDD